MGRIAVKAGIITFLGTNCEFDTKRACEFFGWKTELIKHSEKIEKHYDIIFLPGGFSYGDHISAGRIAKLTPAVQSLPVGKSLIVGICNGFQALVKLGLVPYGEIRPLAADSPTLTYNNIARHVSCYVRTRIASKLSPWLYDCEIGEIHTIPVSHGEGKFIAPEPLVAKMAENGQIATQYVDAAGNPSAEIPFNPNGSVYAIEGITSPCGLVLGKMGHSERFGDNVGKNVCGNKIQPIFAAGVKYFA